MNVKTKVAGPHLWSVKITYGKYSENSLSLWITTRCNSAVEAAQNATKYCNGKRGMYPKLSINSVTNSGTIDR